MVKMLIAVICFVMIGVAIFVSGLAISDAWEGFTESEKSFTKKCIASSVTGILTLAVIVFVF